MESTTLICSNCSVVKSFNEREYNRSIRIHPPYTETYWMFSESILVLISLITLYLLICLLRYAVIKKCRPGREISGRKKGKILYQMCLLSIFMAIGRLTADHIVAFFGWKSDSNCSVSVAFSAVLYSLSLYPVYIFLWLRQSIFYANPVLSHVLNPLVSAASWFTLVLMLLGGAIITVFYVVHDINGWDYVASSSGCRDVSDQSGFELIPFVLVCFTVLFQLSLLGLFVYPLLSEKTQRYRDAAKNLKCSNNENHLSASSEANENESSNQGCSNEPRDLEELNLDAAFNFAPNKLLISSSKFQSNENKSNPINISENIDKELWNVSDIRRKTSHSKASSPDSDNKSKENKLRHIKNSPMIFFDLIKRSRSVSMNSNSGEEAKANKLKRTRTQQGRRIIKFIRKAFLLALICVISDIVFTVTQLMVVVPELVYLVLFDINLLINIVCIITSFREWKFMIVPFCAKYAGRKKLETPISSPISNVESQRSRCAKKTSQYLERYGPITQV